MRVYFSNRTLLGQFTMPPFMKKISPDQCKDSGLALTLILLIAVLANKNLSLVGPAIIVLIITMTIPRIFKPLAWLWFGLANFMSNLGSKIMLTLVFFMVVTPVALWRKIAGKDSMSLQRWKADNNSAFINRDHKCNAADLEKPF